MVIVQEDADGYRTLNDADRRPRGRDRDTPTRLAAHRHHLPARAPATPSAPSSTSPTRPANPSELGVGDPHLLAPRGRRRLPPADDWQHGTWRGRGWTDRRVVRPLRPRGPPARRLRRHRPRGPLHPRRPDRVRHLRARLFGRHDPSGFTGYDSVAPEPLPPAPCPPRKEGGRPMATAPRPRTTTRDPEELAPPPHRLARHPAARRPRRRSVPFPAPTACPARRCSSTSTTPTRRSAPAPCGSPPTPRRTPSSPSTTWPASTAPCAWSPTTPTCPVPARSVAGGGPGTPRGARSSSWSAPQGASRRTSCPTRTRATGCTRRPTPNGSTSRPPSLGPRPPARPSPVRGGGLPRPPGRREPRCAATSRPNAPTTPGWSTGCPRSPLIERGFDRLDGLWPRRRGRDGPQLGRRTHRQHRLRRFRTRGRTRLGDGGPRPRARSTWAGWSTCTASSRTSPSASASRGLPGFLRRDRVEARYARTHRAHAARHGVPHPLRRPAARDRHAARRLPAGALR